MSAFYGTVKGHRTAATRCGSNASGIRASAQSWAGSVVVELFGEGAEIRVSHGSDSIGRRLLWQGPIVDLLQADRLVPTVETLPQKTAFEACRAVLEWARKAGDHGGNPYCHEFVKLARKAVGDVDLPAKVV
jgi:hypothetical protein